MKMNELAEVEHDPIDENKDTESSGSLTEYSQEENSSSDGSSSESEEIKQEDIKIKIDEKTTESGYINQIQNSK